MTDLKIMALGTAAFGLLVVAAPTQLARKQMVDPVPAVAATAGRYASDPTHTSVTWRVRHMGLSNYTARFTDHKVTLQFDPGAIEKSRVEATVNPRSVRTDYPGTDKSFDDEVALDNRFLQAASFPEARFVSDRIERTGPSSARIHGNLTLLGQTRPLVLDATYNGSMASHPFAKVPAIGFSAQGTIRRSQYGMTFLVGQGLADEVDILIEAELIRSGD